MSFGFPRQITTPSLLIEVQGFDVVLVIVICSKAKQWYIVFRPVHPQSAIPISGPR
jgi:hypothetical protein